MFDENLMIQCTFLVLFWLILMVINLGMGVGQSRQGRGTTWRWFWVSGVVALLQISPHLTFCGMQFLFPDSLVDRVREMEDDARAVTYATVGILVYYCVIQSLPYLKAPSRALRLRHELPLVTDANTLQDVAQLAQSFKITIPVAREFKTPLGGLAITAAACGLPAPSIIVTDGLLLRLLPAERRAIIAHELAHLANHSLWFLLATSCVASCLTMMVVSLLTFSWPVMLLSGLVLHLGLFRITSRYFEYDCDRRAARLTGFRAMGSALQKIHVAHIIENSGWRSLLFYSVATHPSIEERLSALRNAAPPDDQLDVLWSDKVAAHRHTASLVAGACWLGALAIACFFTESAVTGILLAVILLSPTLFLRLAIRNDVKIDSKRRYPRAIRRGLMWVARIVCVLVLFLSIIAFLVSNSDSSPSSALQFLCVLLIIMLPIVFWPIGFAVRQGDPFLENAVAQGKWADALSFSRQNSRKVQSNPRNLLLVSLARWNLGEHSIAVEELHRLRISRPDYKQPWLTLALMALEQGEYRRAIDLCHDVLSGLKNDIAPHFLAARAARLLKDSDQQKQSLAAIQAISPRSPLVRSVQMMLELDGGNLSAACLSSTVLAAEMPGDPVALLLQAELEWKVGHFTVAHQIADQLKEIITAAPLLFVGPEWRNLNQMLNRSEPMRPVEELTEKKFISTAEPDALNMDEEDPAARNW